MVGWSTLIHDLLMTADVAETCAAEYQGHIKKGDRGSLLERAEISIEV